MRIKTILCSAFLISGVAAGCAVDDAALDPQEAGSERGRKKLGKADLTGSCVFLADDVEDGQVEKNYCGGKSWGTFWCDEQCEGVGDCCSDMAASCGGAPPPPPPPPQNNCAAGEQDCGGCCGNSLCLDAGQTCPMVMCPAFCPPPKCEDTGGQCVQGSSTPDACLAAGLGNGFGECESSAMVCCGDALPPPPPSCVGHCGGMVGDEACFCDDECSGYGDCCSDYQDVCQ
jgi:hypothetical protein